LIVVLCTILSAAQQVQQGVRTKVDVVVVDFVAVDKRGDPVTGLTPDEIVVTVEGLRRPLSSLALVGVAGSPTQPTPGSVASNAQSESSSTAGGRAIVLVFAHDTIRPGNERSSVAGSLALMERLSPDDRVAVLTMPTGRVEVDLTTNRAAVRAALQKIVGRASEPVPRGGRAEVLALADIFHSLSPLPGRKAVVLISEGQWPVSQRFKRDRKDDVRQPKASLEELTDLGPSASDANVDLFILQPYNLPADASSRRSASPAPMEADAYGQIADATEGLEGLAGVTGGRLFRLSGSPEKVFAQILRETSAYYVAALPVEDSDRTGTHRKLSVRVTRPGVTVRARSAFRVD
jgi:VWFA-related protein